MNKITAETTKKLLEAMDSYKITATNLIEKLIKETVQPRREMIEKEHYYELENGKLLNGEENLTDNWYFDVHGDHCMFKNLSTGQIIEVFLLGGKEGLGSLDPYFFYNFLETTPKLKSLTKYFKEPFKDTLDFFEALENQKILKHISGTQFIRL